MPLRVNDNDQTRQRVLMGLLELYIPTGTRVSLIHEGLSRHDRLSGTVKSDVGNQIGIYLRTDIVIVYGETPYDDICGAYWFARYRGRKNLHYISTRPFDVASCAHGVLAQLYMSSWCSGNELVGEGLDAFAKRTA